MRGWDAWTGLPAPERMSSPTGREVSGRKVAGVLVILCSFELRLNIGHVTHAFSLLLTPSFAHRCWDLRTPWTTLRFYIRPLPCNRRLDVPPCRMTSNPGAPHMARHTPVPAPMPPHVFITGDAARDEDVANSAQCGTQVDAVAHWQHGYSGVTVPPGDGDASAIRRSGSEWSDDRLVYIIDLGGRGVEACRHGDGAVWRGSTGRQRGIGERDTPWVFTITHPANCFAPQAGIGQTPDGTIEVGPGEFPLFLWKDETFEPTETFTGFLRGDILVKG
ncbi:hypothetical protein BD779DRAFT_1709041 [Infundibulicybe gibba]|nr:hypothetical protein BD779DRAFT_1709041 [Infundibulicybe gibba]